MKRLYFSLPLLWVALFQCVQAQTPTPLTSVARPQTLENLPQGASLKPLWLESVNRPGEQDGIGACSANYIVDLVIDENDGNFSSGDLSLREAVQLANTDNCDSYIYFAAPTFSVPQSIILTLGQLTVANNYRLEIYGSGETLLSVSGNNASRIFNISTGASVLMTSMTLRNGRAGNNNSGQGGAIRNNGRLYMSYITLNNNAAAGGSGVNANTGGAVYNSGNASVYAEACTFSQNSATASGGAVMNLETAGNTTEFYAVYCSFIGNTSGSTGGAIQNTAGAFAEVGFALFQNNSAQNGGAIHCSSSTSRVNCANSSFTGNSASVQGGAVRGQSGTLNLVQNTFTANSAPGTGGGGIMAIAGVALNLRHNIVSGNTARDISGTIVSGGYNLIGNTTGSAGWAGTDLQNNPNANIGPLGFYGGYTMCLPIMSGSAAIDAGLDCSGFPSGCPVFGASSAALYPGYDQRFTPRPMDDPGAPGGNQPDMGAFERISNPEAYCHYIPNGQVDEPYSLTLTNNAGGTTWTAGAIPAGLALSPVSGGGYAITGTPTEAGQFNFIVTITNGAGQTVEIGFCITINPGDSPVIDVDDQTLSQGESLEDVFFGTVSDNIDGGCDLEVEIISANPSNGVTLSNFSNSCGLLYVDIDAACGATDATFTLQVTDLDGNTSTTTLTIDIEPVMQPYALTGAGVFCQGGSQPVGLSGSQTGVSYQLKKDGVDQGVALSGTGSALSFPAVTMPGVYTVVATNNFACTMNMTGSLTIVPSPTLGGTSASNVCAGQMITIQLSGMSNVMQTVTYKIGTGANQTVSVTPSGGNASFTIPTQTSGTVVTILSSATTGSPVCTTTFSTNNTVSLTVNPTADATGLTATVADNQVCPGQTVFITLSGATNLANGSYAVTYSLPPYYVTPVTENFTFTGGSTTFSFTTIPADDYVFYVHRVAYPVTDCGQNLSNVSVAFSTNDIMPPTMSCPPGFAELEMTQGEGCEVIVPDLIGLIADADDDCALAVELTQDPEAYSVVSDLDPLSTLTVTVTASDGVNTYDCVVEYLIIDNTPPELDCPDFITLSTNENECQVTVEDWSLYLDASDNCNLIDLGVAQDAFPIGTTENVTAFAYDEAGNYSECTFDVIVSDQTPPAIVCPESFTMPVDEECVFIIGDLRDLVLAEDPCEPESVTIEQAPNIYASGPAGYEMIVTMTAYDGQNNSAQCTFTVTGVDETAPILQCPDDMTVSLDNPFSCEYYIGSATELPGFDLADNCTVAGSFDYWQCPEADCEEIPLRTGARIAADEICEESCVIFGHGASQVVTFYAEDEAGNQVSCSYTITLEDDFSPEFDCPEGLEVAVPAGENCTATVGFWNDENILAEYGIYVYDNCEYALAQLPAPSTPLDFDNPTVVTITATDAAGNTGECVIEVSILDMTPPTPQCPETVIVDSDEQCNGILGAYMPVSATDNCTLSDPDFSDDDTDEGDIDFVYQDPEAGTNFTGSQIVTLYVTDASGNSGSCTFTVVAADSEPPVIDVCPEGAILELGDECTILIPDLLTQLSASDNCTTTTDLVVTQSPEAGELIASTNGEIIVVTVTVEDAAGNTADCEVELQAVDNALPDLTCPNDVTVYAGSGCTGNVGAYTPVYLYDNCTAYADLIVEQTPAAGDILVYGQPVTVTLTATDEAENANFCQLTVTLIDNTPPVLASGTCPSNITIAVDGNCNGAIGDYRNSVTATDACGGNVVLSQTPASGFILQGHNASTTVNIIATDPDNNAATLCTFTVTAKDINPPSITCPSNTTVSPNANCMGVVGARSPLGVSDNCGTPNVTQSPAATATFTGSQVVTLTALDNNSNSATCSFTLSVMDSGAPTITCPANLTVQASANCTGVTGTYSGMISDNCSATQTGQTPAPGTPLALNQPVTVQLTATDGNNNTGTCTFTVELKDVTNPTFTGVCPSNVTVSAGPNCQAVIGAYSVTGSDNCAGTVTSTQSPASNTVLVGHNDAETVTLTLNDGNGNSITACTFTVTLKDATPPTVSNCPANTTVSVNANCQFSVPNLLLDGFTATDNCAGSSAITYSQSPAAGTTASGQTTVQLFASDGNGNTNTSCAVTLTPNDIQAPVAHCKNYTLALSATSGGSTTLTPASVNNNSTDNCGIVSMSVSPNAFTCTSLPTTVTLTVTDAAGLSSSCTAVVTVSDVTPPTANCTNTAVVIAGGSASVSASAVNNNSTDNCGIASMSVSPGSFTCVNLGANTVTLTVTDGAGLTGTCTATVTVNSNTPPTALCKNATLYLDPNQQYTVLPASLVNNGSYAQCGNVQLSIQSPNPAQFSCANLGNNTVVLRATDGSGLFSTCSANVVVRDNTLPNAQCKNISVALNSNGLKSITALQVNNNSTDNCGISSYVVTPSVFNCNNLGANTVTLRVTDNSGNSKTCTATVTVTVGSANCGNAIAHHSGGVKEAEMEGEQRDNMEYDYDNTPGMEVYPNPTEGVAYVSFHGLDDQKVDLLIFDELGRMVKMQSLIDPSGATVTLDLNEAQLQPGVYTVALRSQDRTLTKRLVYVRN